MDALFLFFRQSQKRVIFSNGTMLKAVVLFTAIIGLTGWELVEVFPVVYPNYQLNLFTPDINALFVVNWVSIIISVFFSVLMMKWYYSKGKVSFLVMFYLQLIYFQPGLLMCAFLKTEIIFNTYYLIFYYALIVIFLVFSIAKIRQKKGIKCDRNKRNVVEAFFFSSNLTQNKGISKYDALIIIFALIIFLASIILSDFRISISSLFNQSDVLDIRSVYSERNIHWIIWYPIVCSSIIFPSWIVYSIRQKKYWMTILLVVTTCAAYTVAANRMFIFLMAFGLVISAFKEDSLIIPKCWLIALILIAIEFSMKDSSYVALNVFRRLSLTPNSECRFYIDFFSKNEPDFARQLLERWLSLFGLNSPYDERIPTLIGQTYLGFSNCNTGLVGYSFGNYGFFGLFFGPLLYVLAFKLLDYVSKNIYDNKITHAIAIAYAVMVTNDYGWAEYLLVPSFLLLLYILLYFMSYKPKGSLYDRSIRRQMSTFK